ncbi:ABC-type Zn uptake system ZnuABC, Zn-binding component ZnuA [Brevinema andersonii]|uniref:ABC-type Zn uptake system ZnuABC, Zn-binding component ZnuA n=1 Tax=Brevinema andersonii TaxID=34097 RepID=A0A1I1D8G2_BREAD|nr:metal ABC transporter substrate-binding protein [Brevinema andersonii]SFB69378.1 ABC-type Zn uptake system ZnuABC, Zn-binding component ZnuA [Brevinema andersonii]
MHRLNSISFVFICCVAACERYETKGLSVITGVAPVASLIRAVGKDLVSVEALIPTDADPHMFALKPSDAVKIEKSDLIIALHPDFDAQIVPKDPRSGKVFYLAHEADKKHEHYDHDVHCENLHLWLSFEHSKGLAYGVNSILSSKLPQHSEIFAENTQKFVNSLNMLQNELKNAFQNQKISIIQQHAVWDYFFDELGIDIIGSVQQFEQQQISLQKMVSLVKDARTSGNLLLIADAFEGMSPVMNVLSKEIKAPVIFLNPLSTEDGNSDITGILRENGYKILSSVKK